MPDAPALAAEALAAQADVAASSTEPFAQSEAAKCAPIPCAAAGLLREAPVLDDLDSPLSAPLHTPAELEALHSTIPQPRSSPVALAPAPADHDTPRSVRDMLEADRVAAPDAFDGNVDGARYCWAPRERISPNAQEQLAPLRWLARKA